MVGKVPVSHPHESRRWKTSITSSWCSRIVLVRSLPSQFLTFFFLVVVCHYCLQKHDVSFPNSFALRMSSFCQDRDIRLQRWLGYGKSLFIKYYLCRADRSQAAPDGYSRPVIGVNGK